MPEVRLDEIERARRAFDTYNVRRVIIADGIFMGHERDIFAAVPLLLHLNLETESGPKLNPEAPAGIYTFEPSDMHYSAFNRLFGEAKPIASKEASFIESLAIVGSIGTIAQTEKSDMDFVIFLNKKKMDPKKLDSLQEKVTAIENWTMNDMGVETHFFISDVDDFRKNDYGITDNESVGSALGKMFKDEFYRTAIFIAGKRPLWWVTPPGMPEEKTGEFKKKLNALIGKKADNYLDLGHILKPDLQEFFGGALWQMNKSIQYPSKSLLKMGLLESYLLDPENSLMCEELKVTVLRARGQESLIDPYLMMYERINSFYVKKGMKKEALMLRRAFLLKAGVTPEILEKLQTRPESELTDKQKIIVRLLQKWKWKKNMVLEPDLSSKTISRYQPLGQANKFILDVYRRLSDWLRNSRQKKLYITEEDMTVLGRKLFAYFHRRKNKIYFVYPGNAPDNPPKQLLLIRELMEDQKWYWTIYDYHPITHESGMTKKIPRPLFNCNSLVEMIVWMVINNFWKSEMRLYFRGGKTHYEQRDVRHLLNEMFRFFIEESAFQPSRSDYLLKRRAVKAFVIPNLGYAHSPGKVMRVNLILQDSWGEYSHVRITPKVAYSETAEMMLLAERLNRPFKVRIVPPLSQSDPGLAKEFEYSLGKMKKVRSPSYRRSKKSKLDLV